MRTIAWMAVLLAAGMAQAQQAKQNDAPAGTTAAKSSDAFDRACHDMLHGKMPEGEKAIRTLKDACADLMSGRADERIKEVEQKKAQAAAREQLRLASEGKSPNVQAGQSAAAPQQGTGVLAAFGQAASELGGRPPPPGTKVRAPASYSLYTNPIGWFTGLGVNAQMFGAIDSAPKFSWVTGLRYANADTTNGSASTFGAMAGADWYILGGNNKGMRLGPRLEVAAGRERFGSGDDDTTTFARLGLSGEFGYNFLATNGVSGNAAVGLGGRVAGDSENENFASFVGGDFGPYVSVGLGYSW